MKDLSKMTNIEDLRVVCQRNVPKMFYEYVDTGSWQRELTKIMLLIYKKLNSSKKYW